MIDRWVLAILLLLAGQVFYGRGLREESRELLGENQALGLKLSREQAAAGRREVLARRLEAATALSQANRHLLYPAEDNPGVALEKLQTLAKRDAVAAGLEFINSTWGEPVPDEAGVGYRRLPLALIVAGNPQQMEDFLRRLATAEVFVGVDLLALSCDQKRLMMRLNLEGYQALPKRPADDGAAAPRSAEELAK